MAIKRKIFSLYFRFLCLASLGFRDFSNNPKNCSNKATLELKHALFLTPLVKKPNKKQQHICVNITNLVYSFACVHFFRKILMETTFLEKYFFHHKGIFSHGFSHLLLASICLNIHENLERDIKVHN